jgi:hypothetical protein
VCRFRVAAGAKQSPGRGALQIVWSCREASEHQPSEVWLSPTGSINLGFTTEGRLAAVLILPSSWGSQWGVIYTPSSKFAGAVTREKEDFCKGSLSHSIFYFVIVLLYFIFICIFLSKIQKISSFDSLHFVTFTFSSLCCSLSMLWRTSQ